MKTRWHRCLPLLLVILAIAIGASPAVSRTASGPSTWVQSSYDDFRSGELLSVALDDEGEIRIAPELIPIGDTGEAYVWAVDEAPDGSVFVAAGTEGRVYRFAAATGGPGPVSSETFFTADGTVHAMTVGPDQNLYVAASPGGAIWRLPLSGAIGGSRPEPLFTTGAQYVWSLLVGEDGTVYAGTGDGGVVFRVAADGSGGELYDSSEAHVTALAFDGAGNVLAGTSDNGHLYRISPEGDVFVLFDAPTKQITGIVPTDTGVYFAGLAQEAGARGDNPSDVDASGGEALQGPIYLLHADGLVEQLWGSADSSMLPDISSAGETTAGC